jgi:hypothetical protein
MTRVAHVSPAAAISFWAVHAWSTSCLTHTSDWADSWRFSRLISNTWQTWHEIVIICKNSAGTSWLAKLRCFWTLVFFWLCFILTWLIGFSIWLNIRLIFLRGIILRFGLFRRVWRCFRVILFRGSTIFPTWGGIFLRVWIFNLFL